MGDQGYNLLWYTSSAIAVAGIATGSLGQEFTGIVLTAVGGSLLALLAISAEFRLIVATDTQSLRQTLLVFINALIFILAVAFAIDVIPSTAPIPVRIVVAATGFQALTLTINSRPARISRTARWALLIASHGAMLAGAVLALGWGPTNLTGAILLYAVGFPTLILQAFWIRTFRSTTNATASTDVRPWEALLLVAIICAIPSTLALSLTALNTPAIPDTPTVRTAAAMAGISGVVALASLSAPSSPPAALQAITGPVFSVIQHAVVALILVNTFVFVVFLLVPQLFLWILGAFLLLLLTGVALNYLMIVHAERLLSGAHDDSWRPDTMAVTVVVTGFNEAAVLPDTLEHNLTALSDLEFLLVPAARSTDGTIEVMQEAQSKHPDRVSVIEGTSGSKAGDLNLAWDHIATPYALVLDADETVTSEFITRGLRILDERPAVGIVQGRKVAAYPTQSLLTRFVTIERQHSTLLDQLLMNNVFNAGHFAGSAAILRREVPPAVGGWNPAFLTEDIELTLRLHLQTEWEVSYEHTMIAREINPQTWGDLLRQRERWARGWSQVAVEYGAQVLRSWPRLGRRQTSGVSWLLFTAVSAPIYTILPALALHWVLGLAPPTPLALAVAISLFLFPERGISYVYTAVRDPVITTTPRQIGRALIYGYVWLLFAWVIQLHSLYLNLSGVEGVWHRTAKSTPRNARSSDHTADD